MKRVDDRARGKVADKIIKEINRPGANGHNIRTLAVILGNLRNDEAHLFRSLEDKLQSKNIEFYSVSPRSDVAKNIESVMSTFLGVRKSEKAEKRSQDEADEKMDLDESESVDAISRFLVRTSPKKSESERSVVFILEGLPDYRQSVLEGFIGDIS